MICRDIKKFFDITFCCLVYQSVVGCWQHRFNAIEQISAVIIQFTLREKVVNDFPYVLIYLIAKDIGCSTNEKSVGQLYFPVVIKRQLPSSVFVYVCHCTWIFCRRHLLDLLQHLRRCSKDVADVLEQVVAHKTVVENFPGLKLTRYCQNVFCVQLYHFTVRILSIYGEEIQKFTYMFLTLY